MIRGLEEASTAIKIFCCFLVPERKTSIQSRLSVIKNQDMLGSMLRMIKCKESNLKTRHYVRNDKIQRIKFKDYKNMHKYA